MGDFQVVKESNLFDVWSTRQDCEKIFCEIASPKEDYYSALHKWRIKTMFAWKPQSSKEAWDTGHVHGTFLKEEQYEATTSVEWVVISQCDMAIASNSKGQVDLSKNY